MPIIVAILTVDFARREMRSVEQRLGFNDQRLIGVVLAARRGGLNGCRSYRRCAAKALMSSKGGRGGKRGDKKNKQQTDHTQINSSDLNLFPGRTS
jgi:hypothetical protein